MKHFSRPYIKMGMAALLVCGVAGAPPGTLGQSSKVAGFFQQPGPFFAANAPGYLGVLVGDLDNESAARLKLHDAHGVVVTLIDHDAPAAQAGVRVNDVVLKLNGQAVDDAEHFGRMLRDAQAGRTLSLVISRDGNIQTIAVQLADRKKMENEVWNRIGSGGGDWGTTPAMKILPGGDTDAPATGGFHLPFFGSSLNVGALVEPLTPQMADYLGVVNGLLVKQVARKTEAAVAGLKAYDIILKVGGETIATTSDWDRALRSNQGKTVQVVVLRDRRQQTLTLQVDSKHRRS